MDNNIQGINDRLLFDFPSVQTDVAILLGARSVSGTIAREAAARYHEKQFQHIILSGGARVFQPLVRAALALNTKELGAVEAPLEDFISFEKEADYMKHILLESGVPACAIMHVDNRGTNTGANLANIRDYTLSQGFHSASLISVAYGQRRDVETCKAQIPGIVAFPVPVYPFGITKENWNKTLVKSFVMGEFNKLNPENDKNYYNAGFCAPVDMDALEEHARTHYSVFER